MDIGKRINRLLFENHMEQKDLAEALSFTQTSMSRWVKGTRIPKSEALCAIADYFDVSVDWLLGRSEYRNYNGFISGDDALEYCRQAKESAWKCWYKVANFDVTEISATNLANNTQACAHFEREILRWEYDIPHMIHSLVDGTWKEADRKTEPSSSEKPNNCEDLQDWKDRMWAEAIVTEPTISKMEQVDKDINVRSKDEPQIQLTARCLNCNNAKACKEKHWDGCVYEPKDEKTCETCRHWKYIAHEWQCEACKCQGYEPKDEPQTENWHYDEKDSTWYPYQHKSCATCGYSTQSPSCDSCEGYSNWWSLEDEPRTERSER